MWKLGLVGVLVWIGIVITTITGWVLNIFAIAATQDILETSTGILRVVGIFIFPLGSIMGLFVG